MREPQCGAPMHLPLSRLQERAIDSIADERVHEKVLAVFWADQEPAHETGATVIWVCDQRLKRGERKALAQN